MRILIDTNVFINREDDHVVSFNLQKLLAIISQSGITLLVHPKSKEDLTNDFDEKRKIVMLSKVGAYPMLENPPNYENDESYYKNVGEGFTTNDKVDNSILYSLYKDAIDLLITEDRGIHKKARNLKIEHRVLLISDALQFFERFLTNDQIITPPALIQIPVHNLRVEDTIFDSLKTSYPEFEDWFKKISREGRKAWVYFREDSSIGALLIYKIEDEAIHGNPILPKKKRLKISSFKVTHVGYKIGELFIKMACTIALKNDIEEIYFTYFPKTDDRLIDLVSEYGFSNVAINQRGEEVYLKRTVIPEHNSYVLSPLDITTRYYPSFYDGPIINKYIIPIQPKYHHRLFTGYFERQLHESENTNFIPEGNTILKAYICHAKIRKMKPGDIVLFYLSGLRKVTTIGIVESVDYNLQDSAEIIRKVGKRTVYSAEEIETKAEKPTTVIMFRFHFHFDHKIAYENLKSAKILNGPPQSITQISDEGYKKLIKLDGIDGRYIIH